MFLNVAAHYIFYKIRIILAVIATVPLQNANGSETDKNSMWNYPFPYITVMFGIFLTFVIIYVIWNVYKILHKRCKLERKSESENNSKIKDKNNVPLGQRGIIILPDGQMFSIKAPRVRTSSI